MLATQQMPMKLGATIQQEMIEGEKKYWDKYGEVAFVERTDAAQPVQLQVVSRERRSISTRHFEYSELHEPRDEAKLMRALEPNGPYEQNVLAAWNRKVDSTILSGLTATAYGGKDGTSTFTITSASDHWITEDDTRLIAGTGGTTGLSIDKLRIAKQVLEEADCDISDLWLVIHPKQKKQLIEDDEVKSQDFVLDYPNVSGEVSFIYGMKVITSTQVPAITTTDNTDDGHFAYVYSPDTAIWGFNRAIQTRVDERPDLGHAIQFSVYADIAATRLYEDRLALIECQDAAVATT